MELLDALKSSSIVNVMMVVALGYIAWSLKKGLSIFEKNQEEHAKLIGMLFEKYNSLACDFNQLLGNHEARHGDYLKRRKDDRASDIR